MKKQPFAQDSVERTEKFIIEQGLLGQAGLQKLRAEIAAEVDEAVATAQQEDVPVGSEEDWCALSQRDLMDRVE